MDPLISQTVILVGCLGTGEYNEDDLTDSNILNAISPVPPATSKYEAPGTGARSATSY
jgi:hypothetical protein